MGLQHVQEEKAGKSIRQVPAWAMSTPTAGAGSARHLGNWEFVNSQTLNKFPHRNSSCSSAQGAWTTKQVLAVGTNCQNFTGKGRTKECELLPLTSSQEANIIHRGKGEKREKGGEKKKNKQGKRKKKQKKMLYPQCPRSCWSFLQLGAGLWPGEQVFLPGHTWREGPGKWHPGQGHPGQGHPPAWLVLCLQLLSSVPRSREFVIAWERFKSSLGVHG